MSVVGPRSGLTFDDMPIADDDVDPFGLTPSDVMALIGRFLPPGTAVARAESGTYIVSWASLDTPEDVRTTASTNGFHDALHALVRACRREFLEHALRQGPQSDAEILTI